MTAGWRAELAAAVGAPVTAVAAVAGGDINDAHRVALGDGRVVFAKTHAAPPPGMFAAEAAGLAWLAAGPLRVPRVIAVGATWLALAWLDAGARGPGFAAALGRGLAGLHAVGAPGFGHPAPSFIATLPQDNAPAADIAEYWVERRLRPVARAAGLDLDARLDALRARPDRFGPPEPAARLHGDLWWGNVLAVDGAPVVIDPAVSGGHREIDLAMLALFGELPAALTDAYAEVSPLAPGWRARLPLWQLHPLLVHAALFGGGYAAQAVRTLDALR